MKPTLGASTLLDRLSHKRCDAEFIAKIQAAADARFLVLIGLKPVIVSSEARDDAAIRWFSTADLARLDLPAAEALFLGVDRQTGAGHFALALTEHRASRVRGATEYLRPLVDLRAIATQGVMDEAEVALIGKAKSLAAWHDAARCCGHCGGVTTVKDGGWKRKCWACGHQWFPRIDPVVIMLITDGERCVLGHEHQFPEHMFSTIAGFIEPGEDIEHAVRRESFEELGIAVGEVRFLATQPWPFPHSLMIGCVGFAAHGPLKPDPGEIAQARWFDREDCRRMLAGTHPAGLWVPGRQAIAHTLIRSFVERVPTVLDGTLS
ncbi:MAG: NAD(+) diphosphatase [Hyphomicrobium sp.]